MKRSVTAGALVMALVLAPAAARADAAGITDLAKKDIPRIRKAVMEAMALRDSEGDSAAIARLTALGEESPKVGIGNQYLWREVWREASRFTGREDLDWRRQLDEWLFNHLLGLDPSLLTAPDDNMFILARNMAGAQAEVGRLGEARLGMLMIEGWLRDGFSLQTDPTRFPSIGRGFGVLEDARAREFPVTYGQARRHDDPRGGWYPADELIATTHLDGLAVIGAQHLAEGRWARAAEYAEWTQTAARHHLRDPDHASQNAVNTCMDGWFLGQTVLAVLGFDEVNRRRLEELVGDPLLQGRLGRAQGKIDRMLLGNEVLAEGAGEALLQRIGQLAERSSNDPYRLATDDLQTLQLKVSLLNKLGRTVEAFGLLDQLIVDARRRHAVTTETALRRDWAQLRIEHGKLDGVEPVLLQLLDDARRRGEKMAEPSLYFRYADLLTRTDRLDEAILVWREAVRLVESLSLYTRLPEYLARFADTLAHAGLHEDAAAMRKRVAALLGDGRIYPEGVRQRTGELLRNASARLAVDADPDGRTADHKGNDHDNGPGKGESGSDVPVDLAVVLQPHQLLSAPLKGRLAGGTFTLTNPGAKRRTGQLVVQGAPIRLAQDPGSGFIHGNPDPEAGELALIHVPMGPGQQIRVELAVPGATGGTNREITLEWRDQTGDRAIWIVERAEDGISRAVTDAGLYEENPFFASALFHHVQADEPDTAVNIRCIASADARIEIYDATGLLCIDADGNGGFGDHGDMLAADSDADGSADLVPGGGEFASNIELRVVPHGKLPPAGLQVRLQVRHEGAWVDTAVDTILPHGTPDQ